MTLSTPGCGEERRTDVSEDSRSPTFKDVLHAFPLDAVAGDTQHVELKLGATQLQFSRGAKEVGVACLKLADLPEPLECNGKAVQCKMDLVAKRGANLGTIAVTLLLEDRAAVERAAAEKAAAAWKAAAEKAKAEREAAEKAAAEKAAAEAAAAAEKVAAEKATAEKAAAEKAAAEKAAAEKAAAEKVAAEKAAVEKAAAEKAAAERVAAERLAAERAAAEKEEAARVAAEKAAAERAAAEKAAADRAAAERLAAQAAAERAAAETAAAIAAAEQAAAERAAAEQAAAKRAAVEQAEAQRAAAVARAAAEEREQEDRLKKWELVLASRVVVQKSGHNIELSGRQVIGLSEAAASSSNGMVAFMMGERRVILSSQVASVLRSKVEARMNEPVESWHVGHVAEPTVDQMLETVDTSDVRAATAAPQQKQREASPSDEDQAARHATAPGGGAAPRRPLSQRWRRAGSLISMTKVARVGVGDFLDEDVA